MTNRVALSVSGLKKTFRRKVAVDGASFSVFAGEITGFLGPNGAGKTTIMNMVMGLVQPDGGSIELLGVKGGSSSRDVRLRIGFLQEKPHIYPEMTVRAYLLFFARLYGVANAENRVSEVLDRVGLTLASERRLGTFSRGMQQRACLGRVMLHSPEFLILDEPTLGLDPNGIADMRAIFREMKADGVTLLFSSHQLAEMERICDSVIFMRDGLVIASGRQADLIPAQVSDGMLGVELSEPAEPRLADIRSLDCFVSVRETGTNMVEVTLAPAVLSSLQENRALVAKALTGLGLTVLSVGNKAPSLEDLFIGLTGPQAAGLPNRLS